MSEHPPPAAAAPAGFPGSRRPVRWWRVARRVGGSAARSFAEDRGNQMAAAISYYALLSLVPLTILLVAGFGIVIRDPLSQQRVVDALVATIALPEGTVTDAVRSAAALAPRLAVISLIAALWTAGAVSAALRSALNVVFEVRRSRPALLGKLVDYALLPILCLPVVGSALLPLGWSILEPRVDDLPLGPGFEWIWSVLTWGASLLLTFVAIWVLYWVAPNRSIPLRHLWPGALFTALGFAGLYFGFTAYLANFSSYDLVYGTLAGVMALLFWIFLSANIFILGAEIANEVSHAIWGEALQNGDADSPADRCWRSATWKLLRALVLAPEDSEPTERWSNGQADQSHRSTLAERRIDDVPREGDGRG